MDNNKPKQVVVVVDEKELERVKVLIGFNYPGLRGEKRANEGDLVLLAELPPTAVKGLLRDGVVEMYVMPIEGKDGKDKQEEGGGGH